MTFDGDIEEKFSKNCYKIELLNIKRTIYDSNFYGCPIYAPNILRPPTKRLIRLRI